MTDERELTPKEHAELRQQFATFGDNPLKEQTKRLKSIGLKLSEIEQALAALGCVYEEFGNKDHSEYCGSLLVAISAIKQSFIEFFDFV